MKATRCYWLTIFLLPLWLLACITYMLQMGKPYQVNDSAKSSSGSSNDGSSDSKCRLINRLRTAPGVSYKIYHCADTVVLLANQQRSASLTLRVVSERQLLTVETSGVNQTRFELHYNACYRGRHKAYLRFLHDDSAYDLKGNCMLIARNRTDRVEWIFDRGPEAPVDEQCLEHWIWPAGYHNFTHNNQTLFDKYRDQDSPHPERDNIARYYAGLEYNYPFISKQSLEKCLLSRMICVIGDSQTRNLVVSMMGFVGGSELKVCVKGMTVCQMYFFRYHQLRYPQEMHPSMMANCSDVIVNFGQWQAGWPEGRGAGAWSADRYQQEVLQMLNQTLLWLDEIDNRTHSAVSATTTTTIDSGTNYNNTNNNNKNSGSSSSNDDDDDDDSKSSAVESDGSPSGSAIKFHHLYWLTCNPHPISILQRECPRTDMRFPFILNEYNRRSVLAAKQLADPRLGWIDSTKLMFQMFDASFDDAHYLDPSGSALARLILTELCKR